MVRLILHVGTHKTGTTSIQRALGKYRRQLSKRGILYPGYSIIGKKSHYAHIGIANALANDHPSLTHEDSVKFFSRLTREATENEVVLVSAESMYRQCIGATPPQNAASPEAYWEMRHSYIRKLRELTGPAEIAFVVRNQPDFAESMYQEHVKVTRYKGDFQTFLSDFWFHFQYYEQVMAWKQHFETVHIIPFETLKGPNIAKRFLLSLGLRPGAITTGPIKNVGMPHDGVILKRTFNGTSLNKDQLKELAGVMTDDPFRAQIQSAKRSFFLDARSRLDFHEQYRSGNEALIKMGDIDEYDLLQTTPNETTIYGDNISAGDAKRLTMLICESYPQLATALTP